MCAFVLGCCRHNKADPIVKQPEPLAKGVVLLASMSARIAEAHWLVSGDSTFSSSKSTPLLGCDACGYAQNGRGRSSRRRQARRLKRNVEPASRADRETGIKPSIP
jgi:hypothetical protein